VTNTMHYNMKLEFMKYSGRAVRCFSTIPRDDKSSIEIES